MGSWQIGRSYHDLTSVLKGDNITPSFISDAIGDCFFVCQTNVLQLNKPVRNMKEIASKKASILLSYVVSLQDVSDYGSSLPISLVALNKLCPFATSSKRFNLLKPARYVTRFFPW